MQTLEKKYGPAHRDVAAALNNLAQLYGHQGNDAEAEPLFKRAIAILDKAVGLDSPEAAPELNNLAALYQRQERYAEAEPLFKRALAIREKSLGRDHPDVGQSLNNLATLYEKQGRHGDSEPLFKRALAIYEKAAGPQHPAVATLLNNLGQVDKVQSRYAEAEPLIKRSLAIREKVLGPDHPDVARSLNNLADLYERQGRYAEAQPLFERALAIRERAVGPDHPDTATSAEQSGVVLSGVRPRGRRAAAGATADRKRPRATPRRASGAAGRAAATIDTGRQGPRRCAQCDPARHPVAAASAVNKLAVRLAAGSDRLAELVRRDQDLAAEAEALDKAIVAAVSKERAKRDVAAEAARPVPARRHCRPNARRLQKTLPANFRTTPRCRIRCR